MDIYPATIYDPYKLLWFPWDVSTDSLKTTNQGTYCCESWILFSTKIRQSNCFLITLTEWTTLTMELSFKYTSTSIFSPNTELTINSIQNSIYLYAKKLFPDNSTYFLAPINIFKFYDNQNLSSANFKFNCHIFLKFSHNVDLWTINKLENIIKMSDNLTEIPSNFTDLKSSVKFPTYCKAHSYNMKYGNSVHYPFLKAGEHFNSNYKCEAANNKLIYPICQWNYMKGAEYFHSNCSRIDICPRGFHIINGEVCLKLLLNVTWEEGYLNFYKLGSEFTFLEKGENDSLHQHVRNFLLDSKIENVWLLLRRKYNKTKLLSFSQFPESNLFHLIHPNKSANYQWKKGHPKANIKCMALQIQQKTFYSLDCNKRSTFVVLNNINNLFPYSSLRNNLEGLPQNVKEKYEQNKNLRKSIRKNESFAICKSGWLEMPTSKGQKLCVKFFFKKAMTWSMANKFCKANGANLPSLHLGFNNWFYAEVFKEPKITYWINMKNRDILNFEEFEYLNWLPFTNFSNKYAAMNGDGWFLANNNKTLHSIICEMKPVKTNLPEIFVKKSLIADNLLCVDKYNLNSFGPLKCFYNGLQIRSIKFGKEDCLISIDIKEQGYYQCEMWSEEHNRLIQSNEFLYKNNNYNSYVIIGSDLKKLYDPLIHDSSFIQPNKSFSESNCIAKIYKDLFLKKEKIGITNILFFSFEKDKFYYSYIFTCLKTSQPFCRSKKDVLTKIEKAFTDSNLDGCLIQDVKTTNGCIEDFTIDRYHNRNITWPNTLGKGNIVPNELCVDNKGQPVSRVCEGDFLNGYLWKAAPKGCPHTPSNRTIRIWEIAQDPKRYLQQAKLSELTKETKLLEPVDIYYVGCAFQTLTNDSSSLKLIQFEEIVETMDNIMSASNQKISTIFDKFNSSSIILESFEKLAFKSEDKLKDTKYAFKNKIGSECVNVSSDTSLIGYQSNQIEGRLLKKNDTISSDVDVAIVFPEELTKSIIGGNKNKSYLRREAKVLFVVYQTDILFQDSYIDSLGFKAHGPIIQATYEDAVVNKLNQNVKIIFGNSNNNSSNDLLCVFWDFKKNRRKGGWSERGCYLNLNKTEENFVTCECNHLTSFSLLIKYTNGNEYIESHKKILQLITLIGCGLSMFGLSMVLITFALFRKWRKSLSNQILANLSFAILASLLIFVGGIEQTLNVLLCQIIAIFLNYFILASFGWMLVEGVHQYLKFVKVVGTYVPRFLRKAAICAWGLPALPIIVALSIDPDLYNDKEDKSICWMKKELFLYGFVPLVALVLFINIILFILIIHNVMIKKKVITSSHNRQIMVTQITMAICVSSLLGFTWIFGLLAVSDGEVVFSYLFCIFNTLQGFGIFIFHLCRDRSARRLWLNCLGMFSSSHKLERSLSSYPVTEFATSLRRSKK